MHRPIAITLKGAALGVLVASGAWAGCSTGRPSPETAVTDSVSADEPDFRNAEITILIHNRHWLDLNIYLLHGRVTERLATAAGLSDKVISLPWRRVDGAGTIRLGADPIGQNRGIVTEMIQVRHSAVVEWTIESGLRGFHVSVF